MRPIALSSSILCLYATIWEAFIRFQHIICTWGILVKTFRVVAISSAAFPDIHPFFLFFFANRVLATWMSFRRNPSSTSRCWVIHKKENRFKSCSLSSASLYGAQNRNEKTLLDLNANKVKTRSQRVCWIISALSGGNSKICTLQLTTE